MNKFSISSNNKSNQSGMTFIEVLIALVIIVTGILGAVAMQATAKQGSFDAMQRSLASSLAQDIIGRIRSNGVNNIAAYSIDDYGAILDDVPVNQCTNANAPCNEATMVINDMYEWELSLIGGDVTENGEPRGGLIGGRGCIFQNGNAVTVVVSWLGRNEMRDSEKSDDCGIAGARRRQVIVEAFII